MPFMSAQHFREMWYKTEHARARNSPELEELKKFWMDMSEPDPYADLYDDGDDDHRARTARIWV